MQLMSAECHPGAQLGSQQLAQGSAATLHSWYGGFGLQTCMRPPLIGDAEHLKVPSNPDQSSGPAVSLQTVSVASCLGRLGLSQGEMHPRISVLSLGRSPQYSMLENDCSFTTFCLNGLKAVEIVRVDFSPIIIAHQSVCTDHLSSMGNCST